MLRDVERRRRVQETKLKKASASWLRENITKGAEASESRPQAMTVPKWPTRAAARLATAKDPTSRKEIEEAERLRWPEALRVLIVTAAPPNAELLAQKSDGKAVLRRCRKHFA